MPSQPNSLFPSPGRHNAIGFGTRLSAIALLVTLLAGCDNSAAKNAAPPPPAVSAADVQALAKRILRIQNRTTGLLRPVAATPAASKEAAL